MYKYKYSTYICMVADILKPPNYNENVRAKLAVH